MNTALYSSIFRLFSGLNSLKENQNRTGNYLTSIKHPSSSTIKNPTESFFTPFSRLPPELRDEI
jgi:hypothetical protein